MRDLVKVRVARGIAVDVLFAAIPGRKVPVEGICRWQPIVSPKKSPTCGIGGVQDAKYRSPNKPRPGAAMVATLDKYPPVHRMVQAEPIALINVNQSTPARPPLCGALT